MIYCRISRDPGHDELGVRRQEADCRKLCEQAGYEVAAVHVDDDRSAYSAKRRPGFEAVKAMLAAREADVLVAWHPDRITRHPRELEDVIDLLNVAQATVRTVQAGEYDLATESGRMTARIVGAVARHESEHKSARLRRKHVELAERGRNSGGGLRPYGFTADRLHVVEAEAEVVRELAARLLAGETLRSLLRDLQRRGIRTASGAEWTWTTLRRMLSSARIAGLREHHGVVVARAEWPPIIDEDTWRRLRATFDARSVPTRAPRRYVLMGLLFCSGCGAKLVARPRSDKRPCYVCSTAHGGCGHRRTLAEPIETLVVDAVLERLAGQLPAVADGAGGDDVGERLAAIDARLAELGEMWAAGEIDRAGWRAARTALEADRAAVARTVSADGRRAVLASLPSELAELRAAWAAMPVDARRQVLGEVIERIDLAPAVRGRNTFDPSRVHVTWIV